MSCVHSPVPHVAQDEAMPLAQHVVPSMTQAVPITVQDILDFSNLHLTDSSNVGQYDVAAFQSALMEDISPLLGF